MQVCDGKRVRVDFGDGRGNSVSLAVSFFWAGWGELAIIKVRINDILIIFPKNLIIFKISACNPKSKRYCIVVDLG